MKIIFVAAKYEYGKKERGLSFEYYNFYDTLVKMNGKKNQVIYFPVDEMVQNFGRHESNKKLLEIVFKEKPDVCFFFLSNDEFDKETIKKITDKSGAVTLNWFADDHWRFYNFSRHWAPCFNWVVTTDPKSIEKYHAMGYKNVIMSQWACNHFLCKPLNLPKIYDVTFLGQPHGNRKKIVKEIEEAGINITCWGFGWSNGSISFEEMIEMFSRSKINIGLTNSSSFGVIKSFISIFLKKNSDKKIRLINPKDWLDNLKSVLAKKRNQLKGRNFDVPGCNSFLLTQDADDLENRYEDGKEVVIFKNVKDLISKIRYYLEHEQEREAIAMAGYERTIKEHTYEKRFQEIFKTIGLKIN